MPETTVKTKGISLENLDTFAGEMKKKYARKDDIPVNVSDLINDAKYQTDEQVASAVAAAVASADHLTRKKVASLDDIDPAAEDADKYIYMVPKTGSDEDDLYDEYMVLDGKVEHVGNTKIDLSGYAETEKVAAGIEAAKTAAITQANAATDEKLAGYVKTTDIETATEAEILALFAD